MTHPDEPPVPADGTPWVIDMIPVDQSNELHGDSEAFLAIHPIHSNILVATAFTECASGSSTLAAPIYMSVNGGQTWALSRAFPGIRMTGDATVAFHPAGTDDDELRAAILRHPDSASKEWRLYELTGASVPLAAPMAEFEPRAKADQPFLTVAKDGQWFVTHHDLEKNPGLGVDHGYVDPLHVGTTQWEALYLEANGQGLPANASVRMAVAPGGRAYSAFARKIDSSDQLGTANAEVVVKRDDDLTDARFFEDLQSSATLKEIVVKSIYLASFKEMGQQRIGLTLALAVDPTDSLKVWIAWADGDYSTLHVRRSTDGGKIWSDRDVRTIPQATNAALAIAADGTVGLLYQRFVDSDVPERWETHFERVVDAGGTNVILASFQANNPGTLDQPYLGDYACLIARDDSFHGVFCSSNGGSFPCGVIWQRNHDTVTNELLDLSNHPLQHPSIDPFYFRARVRAAGAAQ